MTTQGPTFRGGQNMALKVPPDQYGTTLRFYRDVLKLPEISDPAHGTGFEFGPNRLWIDRAPAMSQAELWLEIVADDVEAGAEALREAGTPRRDEIEPLPEGFRGFRISSPSSIIHLVCEKSET
ncbi:MAG: hypothetical protein AAGG07_05005 [Planctomycetota bacterium]